MPVSFSTATTRFTGMTPRLRQPQTLAGATPTPLANLTRPPAAAIARSTMLSISDISHKLKKDATQILASSELEIQKICHQRCMSLAKRLRTLREHATLSQADVAAALDVSIPTISEWEKGRKKPSRARIPLLASLYNVTTDFILNGIDLRRSDMSETDEEKSLVDLYRHADPQVRISVLTLLRAASEKIQ